MGWFRFDGRRRRNVLRIAAALWVIGVAVGIYLTYRLPQFEVCRSRVTAQGSVVEVCGPVGTDDILLVGLAVLPALLLLLWTDLSEVSIAGVVTLKRQVEKIERRQHQLEQTLLGIQVSQQSQRVDTNVVVGTSETISEAIADVLRGQSTIQTQDVNVESEDATRRLAVGEMLSYLASSDTSQLTRQLVATVTSAGVLAAGRASYAGALTFTLKRPLGAETRTVIVSLETPGVTFDGTPILSANSVGGSVSGKFKDRKTLVLSLTGPGEVPLSIVVSGFRLSVRPDVPVGTVISARLSVDGEPAHGLASLGTVGPVAAVAAFAVATPTLIIGGRDQAVGLVTVIERGAGEMGGAGPYPKVLRLRLAEPVGGAARTSWTRAPWIVVTEGDLKLAARDRPAAGTAVRGTVPQDDAAACEWLIWSPSTVRSVLEIRGSDASGVVLPAGATNGPRIDVDYSALPIGVVLEMALIDVDGTRMDVVSTVSVGYRVRSLSEG